MNSDFCSLLFHPPSAVVDEGPFWVVDPDTVELFKGGCVMPFAAVYVLISLAPPQPATPQWADPAFNLNPNDATIFHIFLLGNTPWYSLQLGQLPGVSFSMQLLAVPHQGYSAGFQYAYSSKPAYFDVTFSHTYP